MALCRSCAHSQFISCNINTCTRMHASPAGGLAGKRVCGRRRASTVLYLLYSSKSLSKLELTNRVVSHDIRCIERVGLRSGMTCHKSSMYVSFVVVAYDHDGCRQSCARKPFNRRLELSDCTSQIHGVQATVCPGQPAGCCSCRQQMCFCTRRFLLNYVESGIF
jgi:hypothetical protein